MKLAIILYALLMSSLFTMTHGMAQQQAYAQVTDTTKYTLLQLHANYSDGSSIILDEDSKNVRILGQTLVTGTKTINSFTIKVITAFADNVPRLITSSAVSQPSIKVLATDGNYKTVPTTGADIQHKCLLGPVDNYCTAWQLYSLTIPRTTLEGIIGVTSESPSDLRVTFCTGCLKFTTKPQSGASVSYEAVAQTVSATFTAKDIVSGGGGTGDFPTGKLYTNISVVYEDGSRRDITVTDLGPLSPATLVIKGEGIPIKEITYKMLLVLDQNFYNMPRQVTYANPGSLDNYGVFMDSLTKIGADIAPTIQISGSQAYTLMRMTAVKADIEPHVTKELGNDGTYIWTEGEIRFHSKEGTLALKTPTDTFNVNIPAQNVRVDLVKLTAIDGGDPCDIVGENTDCTPGGGDGGCGLLGGVASALNVDCGLAIVISGSGMLAMVGGSIFAYSKARARGRRPVPGQNWG